MAIFANPKTTAKANAGLVLALLRRLAESRRLNLELAGKYARQSAALSLAAERLDPSLADRIRACVGAMEEYVRQRGAADVATD